MNRFVHVGFAFPGVPKMRDLEPIMSALAEDWIRYSATNWILWTNKSQTEIANTLISHVDVQDQMLVVPIDLNQSIGRLSPWIWSWMNSKGIPTLTNQYLLPKS